MALSREDRIVGALLGCAVGDALGLPAEGMKPAAIARRFGALERFHLVGRTGFVSDDTEQTALLLESLVVARGAADVDTVAVLAFRRRLAGWFLRLPFGIGLATLRACLKLLVGLRQTGVRSAGNGAAMRAPILGVALDDAEARARVGTAIARVTHDDDRAIQGALYLADLAARAAQAGTSTAAAAEAAMGVVVEPSLRGAIEEALRLAASPSTEEEATARIGTTGFVLHTVPLVAFVFARHGDDVMGAIRAAILAGGDTDTHAAIVGAIVGARHGVGALPAALIERLQPGPFGADHLRGLARAFVDGAPPPRWSWMFALLRNLTLYPVVLAHGFRRIVPF